MVAESLISDLQLVGCLPCSKMFYCCPAWAAEKKTGQGQIHSRSWSGGASAAVWDCGLLWWWLSLLAQIASAEDVSSFATSILFSLNLVVSSDDSSAVPITAWRSYLQKAAAGQCESCSLSTPGLFFLQRCYLCVHTTQYSSIPISPSHLSSETNHRMAEGGEEQDGFFSLLNLYWKSQAS